jgi:ParB family chromosome partitioning protein
LSYLPAEQQAALLETMQTDEATPSLAQAQKMKKFAQDGKLNGDVILSIMAEEKPNQREKGSIPRERLSKYCPEGTSMQKIEDTIFKALDLWRKRERSRDDAR